MGSLGDKLRAAQTVVLDSALFIYHFEEHPRYKALCRSGRVDIPTLRLVYSCRWLKVDG